MAAKAPAFVRSWRVGEHHTVTLVVAALRPGTAVTARTTWSPPMPLQLTAAELAEFRRGRDAALRELSEVLAASVAAGGAKEVT